MLKNIKQGMFPFLIAFSALSVSASAAFYSVSGLSKLFAGASLEVIIMAGSLEFAKLVTASLLYQYWDTINKTLRTYLSIATIILVLITSMGIYGFLSAAYQETYNKLSIVKNEKAFIQQKINFYQNDVTRYDEELKRISNNISTLSNARSQQIQVRDTSVVGGVRTTISTSELRLAASRIKTEEENRKGVQFKREIAADSLQKFQLQVLELDNNTEVAGELGPLQYLSGLTGTPMDKIINILLLIIIFVFDPLAISLVVAANFAFDKAYPKRKTRKNLYGENIPLKEIKVKDSEELKTQKEFMENLDNLEKKKGMFPKNYNEEDEKRMDIIGQNGNDGEHYDKLDVNKDGIISNVDQEIARRRITEIERIQKEKPLTQEWMKNLKKEKSQLENKLDELTKRY
tara:strand:- start:687 stop:1895 length:1209 start_codon:yes stop_codon:yes gene_type:complete